MEKLHIRPFREEDVQATAAVFFKAVRDGTKDHYTEEQRTAWAPKLPPDDVWHTRLTGQTVFVAEIDGIVVGFMSLTESGLIDLAFVHPDYMRRGISDALYKAILAIAKSRGLTTLATEASHPARRFFERHDWQVEAEQSLVRNGTALINYRMSLALDE